MMELHESGENYLKTLLALTRKLGQARSIDLAHAMGVSKPSVSHAVAQLRSGGYLRVEGGALLLTEKGRRVAEELEQRCRYFEERLMDAGIAPETAKAEACRLEHAISAQSFQKLQAHRRSMNGSGERA
jgi:Mn-dependent DtxR family transcriptional regulator